MADAQTTTPVVVEGHSKVPALVGMLMAVVFLMAVVTVEVVIAYFLFPSAEDTEQLAQAMIAASRQDKAALSESELAQDEKERATREVDLGQFDVSSFQPLSNTTLRISVHVYAAVAEEDEAEFQRLMELKQQRIREDVVVILRNAELSDLTDAGLGLIKRKILEKTNRSLGKSLLREIIVSEISFLEQ